MPLYSAVKIEGIPMYRLAREGISVEKVRRTVEILELRLLSLAIPYLTVKVSCSKGTYIRALAEDIGNMLGCGAHITNLERTAVGQFSLKDACTLERMSKDVKTFGLKVFEEKYMRPVDLFLKDFGSLLLSDYEFDKVITGVAIKAPEDLINFSENILVRLYDKQNKFVGLGETRGDKVFPKRLINTKNIRE